MTHVQFAAGAVIIGGVAVVAHINYDVISVQLLLLLLLLMMMIILTLLFTVHLLQVAVERRHNDLP